MDSVYSTLAARCLEKHEELKGSNGQRRTIIALAGPPGSGKSTVAAAVVQRLNREPTPVSAVVLPMDGFHLPRKALDMLPNVSEAYERRGAAWTFDSNGVVDLVEALHRSKHNQSDIILAPTFDHVLKDPCENGIKITPDVSIVIVEGNWLLLDEDPWRRISQLVDDTWFVDVAPELARTRIATRHIESGIESTWEAAVRRAESNDLPNGDDVRRRMVKPAIAVQSVELQVSAK